MKSLVVILVRHKRVKRDFSHCLRYIPISFQKYDFPMGAFTYDVTCWGVFLSAMSRACASRDLNFASLPEVKT